jgi:cathepsin L
MQSAVLLCLLALATVCAFTTPIFSERQYAEAFEEWVNLNNRVYDERELLYRFRVWSQNLDEVYKHNSAPGVTYKRTMNQFADLTQSEFLERYTGLRMPVDRKQDPGHVYTPEHTQALPASVDWRYKGVVTGVKDQGQCGSCWSFSATGSIEGAFALNYTLVSLSEQQLMDCSFSYGNHACAGGWMDSAFSYVINNGGIDSEASYPYEMKTNINQCRYSTSNKVAWISSYKDIPSGSESDLQNAVAYHGPVSVAIDASQSSFNSYSGGYYYEPSCSSSNLDHGVLVVGYGTGSSGDYWIVKNSWGTGWGDQGYIYMARNKGNNCGIATAASFPIV